MSYSVAAVFRETVPAFNCPRPSNCSLFSGGISFIGCGGVALSALCLPMHAGGRRRAVTQDTPRTVTVARATPICKAGANIWHSRLTGVQSFARGVIQRAVKAGLKIYSISVANAGAGRPCFMLACHDCE